MAGSSSTTLRVQSDERGTVAFIDSDGSGLEIAIGNEFIGEGSRPHP